MYSKYMTKNECEEQFQIFHDYMFSSYGVDYLFDTFLPYDGVTERKRNSFEPSLVRIRQKKFIPIETKTYIFRDVPVLGMETKEFLRIFYALKHEERHVQQYTSISEGVFYGGLDYFKLCHIANESLAISYNDMYYHQGNRDSNWDNGAHMLMELDAQKFAIEELYSYCESEYGKAKAEELVFDIIASELNITNNIYAKGKDYISIPDDCITFDDEGKICFNNLTVNDILKLYDSEIEKAQKVNNRHYISRDRYYHPSSYNLRGASVMLGDKDLVFEWFEENFPGLNFDFESFPEYFETSADVDKFVIIATNTMMQKKKFTESFCDMLIDAYWLQSAGFV